MVKTIFSLAMLAVAVAALTYVYWLRDKFGYRKPKDDDNSDDLNLNHTRDTTVQTVHVSEFDGFEESDGVVSLAKRRVLKSLQAQNVLHEDGGNDRSPGHGDRHQHTRISGGTYSDD